MHDTRDLYTILLEDHPKLEALYQRVVDACEADAPELGPLWTELDGSLTRHLAAEEEHVFPALAEVAPAEVEVLRAQHDDVRKRLVELGVCIDLHTIRKDVADAFLDALRLHGQREDALMHVWLRERIASMEA
jgi:iron-sulfur cluster repair protein YtfE (RIC family)